MGNKGTKGAGASLKAKDVARYSSTGFTADEIQALYGQFIGLKGSEAGGDNTLLSLGEFQTALGFGGKEPSLFLERVFKLMDANKDGNLTFEEFINGVAVFSPNATERKIKFTFALYDADGKGKISATDLKVMLGAVLRENGVSMTEPQVDMMVGNTFREHDTNGDGFIDYDEYKQMCAVNQNMLKPLTINVGEILREAKAEAPPAGGK